MNKSPKYMGFTLVEVVVALFILGLVLSSTLAVVHHYADERGRLRARFFSTQVAWNRLMERYQRAEKWVATTDRRSEARKGVDDQAGQLWRWNMKIKPAMGQDLYRYEVQVGLDSSDKPISALALYLVTDDPS